jgi:amino acid transporter
MKISLTWTHAILGLAAVATSCAWLSRRNPGGGGVYHVGVAGGG